MMSSAVLSLATGAAARRLGARGLQARAEGATLHCTFPGGNQLVMRSRLEPDAAFDRELLLNNVAAALLAAELEEGARD